MSELPSRDEEVYFNHRLWKVEKVSPDQSKFILLATDSNDKRTKKVEDFIKINVLELQTITTSADAAIAEFRDLFKLLRYVWVPKTWWNEVRPANMA